MSHKSSLGRKLKPDLMTCDIKFHIKPSVTSVIASWFSDCFNRFRFAQNQCTAASSNPRIKNEGLAVPSFEEAQFYKKGRIPFVEVE